MKKGLRNFIAMGVVVTATFAATNTMAPQKAEAGWLGNILGSVTSSTSNGKTVEKYSATQIDKVLHEAVKNNDYDMTADAIARGANVNSMYNDALPLDHAISYISWPNYDTSVADLLIDHGADIEGWVEDGRCHYYSFLAGNNEAVIYLLDKGLNVNLKDENGVTLLMNCVVSTASGKKDHSAYVQEIVNRGADVNARATRDYDRLYPNRRYYYYKGDTALIGAAACHDVETARVLLYAGADKNIRNSKGKTALDVAIDSGNTEMIDLLMNWNGAN